jgi:hypothetical protein
MPQGKGTYGKKVGRPRKAAMGMKAVRKEEMMYKKGGKATKKVMIPAPKGHHWMNEGGRFYLMAHGDKFVPHKGAMLEAPFEIREAHSASYKKG